MKQELSITNTKGFSVVEILLSIALFALIVSGISSSYTYGQESTIIASTRARAVILAEEGLEITRSIRGNSLANLTDGTHGIIVENGDFTLTATPESDGVFTRSVLISSLDSTHKKITSTVTWQKREGVTDTVSLTEALSDWQAPQSGSVEILSTVINTNGSKTTNDFAPYHVGSTAVTLGEVTNIPVGTYTVDEQVLAGYTPSFSGDCDQSGSITITANHTSICTITNTEQ